MTSRGKLALLFLHALPLDGSMWANQGDVLPGATYTPTLYSNGGCLEAWAADAVGAVHEKRIIVIGCSIGGSCALEVAALAPERIAGLVLIGTKARHSLDPAFHAAALETLRGKGMEAAWAAFWAPLFSVRSCAAMDAAKRIFLRQSPENIVKGVTAFHSRKSRDDVLAQFSGPIAIVTGADDTAPGPKTSAAQAEAARRGTLYIVPNCGHYVPLEQPAQLNQILRHLVSALP